MAPASSAFILKEAIQLKQSPSLKVFPEAQIRYKLWRMKR